MKRREVTNFDYKSFMESFKNCRACQFYDDGPGTIFYEGVCHNKDRILKDGKIIRSFVDGGDCKFFLQNGFLPFEGINESEMGDQ